MSFVKFGGGPRPGARPLDGVILGESPSRISLGKGLRHTYDQQEHTYVQFYLDEGARLVAFRFTNDKRGPKSKVTRRPDAASIACLAFIRKAKEFGYPMSTRLPVKQVENGLLVIEKEAA